MTSNNNIQLKISKSHWQAMYNHVLQAMPFEACGLVAGVSNTIVKVIPISNILKSLIRFRMAPQEQLDAFIWIDTHELSLVAIFHSHPNGPSFPSVTDITEAAYPETIHLIWSHWEGNWTLRGFVIDDGHYEEVHLELSDEQP
jgi:proteasome lid subunit RPN8/RPN11